MNSLGSMLSLSLSLQSDDHLPTVHSQSARSSLSNGRTLSSASTKHSSLPPFTRLSVELNSDTTTNTLLVHLTDVELIRMPTIFAEHAEYFIRVQLLNNKLLKKFQSLSKSPRSRLPLDTWRNQQEQTTKSALVSLITRTFRSHALPVVEVSLGPATID